MSTEALIAGDPFAISVLDEETELRALENTLRLSDGFALIFARCNQSQQRKRLIDSLRKDMPQLNVQEVHFTEQIVHLLDELRERITGHESQAVFVSGLEYSLPVAADAHSTALIANLNAARNSFPQVLRYPLVLWIPEYVLAAIARGAPDFFSIRSGVYYFAATPDETSGTAHSLVSGDEQAAVNLSLREKQERIRAIEGLLADYEALQKGQRDFRSEARLHFRLGTLYYSLSYYANAQEHYESARKLARELAEPSLEARTLHGSALVFRAQGKPDEAEEVLNKALEVSHALGQRSWEAATLNSLAGIYVEQENYDAAENNLRQALNIVRDLRDETREATTLANLGQVYANQGRLREAEATLLEALAIHQRGGDRANYALCLLSLGVLFASQGRVAEATSAFERSAQIAEDIGNRDSEVRALINLALLKEQEDPRAAVEFARKVEGILRVMDSTPLRASAIAKIEHLVRDEVVLAAAPEPIESP